MSEKLKPNEIARDTSIEDVIKIIKERYPSSTKVVGWYSDHPEVRGPFGRWLVPTEVNPEYQKHVASIRDDAKYAEAAMNYSPVLVNEVERLQSRVAALEDLAKEALKTMGYELSQLREIGASDPRLKSWVTKAKALLASEEGE